MLEDKSKGIVYVAFSAELLHEYADWSEPLQVKVEVGSGGELEVTFRRLETTQAVLVPA